MPPSKVLSIDDPRAIPTAKRVLADGGLIVFPTDTIYGVAADAFNALGIQRIYEAKERPRDKALPVLIGEIDQLDTLVLPIRRDIQRITEHFWPGALTIVLAKKPDLPANLSPYPTIGVRMPDSAFTRVLLCETGPLATSSANLSGGQNPLTAQDALKQIGRRVDLILDGGSTPGMIASTVVDATGPDLKILREGPISLQDLKAVFSED